MDQVPKRWAWRQCTRRKLPLERRTNLTIAWGSSGSGPRVTVAQQFFVGASETRFLTDSQIQDFNNGKILIYVFLLAVLNDLKMISPRERAGR
jgi:hypothetical protein